MADTNSLIAVFLPGLDGSGAFFGPIIQQLPPQWQPQTIAYPLSIAQDYSRLGEYVLAQLPTKQPYILIAESFAGPLALQISTRTGANLNALVLSATFVHNPRPYLAWLAPLLLREFVLARRPPNWLLRYLVAGSDAEPGLLDDLRVVLDDLSPNVLLQRLRAILTVDVSAQLSSCQTPILHLYATRDRLLPVSASDYIRRLRPDITSIGIDGPHFLLQTRPRQCLAAIREFLLSRGIPD